MRQVDELRQKIIEETSVTCLSESLTELILLAQEIQDAELERWAKLESDGYVEHNPAMRKEDAVPEYRTVAGRYMDYFNRPLVIEDPELHSIQQVRLWHSVAELEGYANAEGWVSLIQPDQIALLKKHLDVDVYKFVFSPVAIKGVLNAIRNQILERLRSGRFSAAAGPETPAIAQTARRIIFVSKSFAPEDEELNGYFEGILRALRVPFETAEKYAGVSVPQKVDERLRKCDFLIGIYVKRYEDKSRRKVLTTQWLIRETGFVKGEGKDLIALVEEGITDLAGLDAEKELILFDRMDKDKMLRATVRFLEALVFHGFVRDVS